MKNKASLMLIELSVLLVVFALAVLLCIQAFLKADDLSMDTERCDRALLLAQSAAEMVKSCRGDRAAIENWADGQWQGSCYVVGYDSVWQPRQEAPAYRLQVELLPTEISGLGRAQIAVFYADTCLIELPVGWQEVDSRES